MESAVYESGGMCSKRGDNRPAAETAQARMKVRAPSMVNKPDPWVTTLLAPETGDDEAEGELDAVLRGADDVAVS